MIKGLHLVVEDMAASRVLLTERGIELSEVEDMGGVLYSYFSDPDGNMWACSSGLRVTRRRFAHDTEVLPNAE